ncbi:hypothetical protein B0A50_03593 [Salinomyces thailandicus]|uniref:Uncharacterized protein n=1 Tax=Salinomyces thailandicus TaxID=706561 RepID=A0A4U0U3G6_9PEZI|nr:hypothetical protein B0A50_03593 [Salinomyces thailandica]
MPASLLFATLATLTTTALTLAFPQTTGPTTGGPFSPFPTNTTVHLYQGPTCLYDVGIQAISSSQCVTLTTEWVSVPQAPNNNCTFAVFQGDDHCDAGAGGLETYQVSAGSDSVCLYAGVLQQGIYHGSGMWTCG